MKFNDKYVNMTGKKLFETYLMDTGVTEEELDLYEGWNKDADYTDMDTSKAQMERIERIAASLLLYRDLRSEQVLQWFDSVPQCARIPWADPATKAFQPYSEEVQAGQVWTVPAVCFYQGKIYVFGIGKTEAILTEELAKNGQWKIYKDLQ